MTIEQYYNPSVYNNPTMSKTWKTGNSIITYTCPVQDDNLTYINSGKPSTPYITMRPDGSISSFDIDMCIGSANSFTGSKTPDNAIASTIIQIIAMLETICKEDGLEINEQIMKLKWRS